MVEDKNLIHKEIAKPWKMGSNCITLDPIIAAKAVSETASITASFRVRPSFMAQCLAIFSMTTMASQPLYQGKISKQKGFAALIKALILIGYCT
jgi:hypothetical protein